MKNWENYYNSAPLQVASDDYLRQVGKTVSGKTIDNRQFDLIVKGILNNLDITEYDVVLDLCCGNGLITREISKHCGEIKGVDYSKPLIDVAKNNHVSDNCDYLNKSVLELSSDNFSIMFSKIYMYEALQHFSAKQFEEILKIIINISKPHAQLFVGSVPNKEKLWKFYNSISRKFDYLKRKIFNTEAIGYWWQPNSILEICNKYGIKCTILNQNSDLYTAHYRFDVLIEFNRN